MKLSNMRPDWAQSGNVNGESHRIAVEAVKDASMTRILKSKYKIDRRLRCNLWGRPKSPFNKREYPPGLNGQNKRRKPSDFGIQLMAKQRLKSHYGYITEKQFRNIFFKIISKILIDQCNCFFRI